MLPCALQVVGRLNWTANSHVVQQSQLPLTQYFPLTEQYVQYTETFCVW